ncbi:hypothetical protein ACH4GP_31585 [Streptomyces celluloflavus]|uniref:Transposase n=1 Tax=Streptomyces celluloflavus TaxID=58344 RepID=A0ABW7RLB7_9ACTN
MLANPDGTFTWKQYVHPAFAKVDGVWKDADTTLRKRVDERVVPAAATFRMSFSGGGDEPLAAMEKEGKSLSITWPEALPEPRLDGDTAVYPEALPGVDLRIQADVDGAPLPKRWTVERTYGWLMFHRRLARDYEALPARLQAVIHLAMTDLMARRVTGETTVSWRSPTLWDQIHTPG